MNRWKHGKKGKKQEYILHLRSECKDIRKITKGKHLRKRLLLLKFKTNDSLNLFKQCTN